MKNKNCLIVFVVAFAALAAGKTFSQKVQSVETVGYTVEDMGRTVDFFTKVLQFKKVSEEEVYGEAYEKLTGVFGGRMKIVRMQLGDEFVEFTDYLTSGGKPIPVDAKSNDLFFQHIAIVVSDMDKAFAHLKKYNVEYVSTAPQTIPATNKPAAGVKAFYFHDPDGHTLELIYFPAGKGNVKWQHHSDKLFLGIDHTAIGVSSTGNSLQFYRDVLGLELKGETFNYGTEQEHLNNVKGASLHISGLRSASGPGVEFLEYLKPGAGKIYPSDAQNNDIVAWQTTMTVDNLDAVMKTLKEKKYVFVSTEKTEMKTSKGEKYNAAIVKDPDGHLIVLKHAMHETN
jgi:catechol 2,3-dioxygenase-like lactoylglutathione lyase family enzyme